EGRKATSWGGGGGGRKRECESVTRGIRTASEAGRSGRASNAWRSPSSSNDRNVNAAGVRRRWRGLSREISTGVAFATAAVVRLLLAVERSAEAVVPAGIVVVAGKGRTQGRGVECSCSWESR